MEEPTTLARRFTTFLNIKPGEERLIGLLALLYFILALAYVFVQSMAFGVFIAEYGVEGLPFSYITIAVLASIVALLYIRLGGRVSFSKLLSINLAFLGAATLLIWLALNTRLYHSTAFILPLWFQIVVNLGNLAVWPLAGILFDFRQGKRLFPLIGAGNWLGNIIGGLLVPVLVRSIGTSHLLLLAVLSLTASLVVLRIITRSYLREKPAAPQKPHTRTAARPRRLSGGWLTERYIVLIFAYTLLWWVAFFFVDNIFLDRASAQYPDASQLTGFIGQLVSMMGIVALITSTLVTSRLIARFGLRAGLLGMPVAVIISISALAIGGSIGASLLFVFILSALAKLLNVAFGFSLSQSANAVMYQALPDRIRPRIQATAEGIVQPVAMGLAGLSLLALTVGLNLNYTGLAYVFTGLGAALLIAIFLLSGSYIKALKQAVIKRRLGETTAAVPDPESVALLKSRLLDPHPGVALYALNTLDKLDPQSLLFELPNLVRHPAPEVRREAFAYIECKQHGSLLHIVQGQLLAEDIPGVRETALRALAAVADGSPQALLAAALCETDPRIVRGALIGLLKYRNDPEALQMLDGWLSSSSSSDRVLAIQILGEVNRPEHYPYLVQACDAPETSKAAGHALLSIGADALPAIEAGFSQPDAPTERLISLSSVLGRIGGACSQRILWSRVSAADDELRLQILKALSQSGYRSSDQVVIQQAVSTEAAEATRIDAIQVDLGNADEIALLNAALAQMFERARQRILFLLSFIFDTESSQHVREALLSGSPARVSYALEIMDMQLPAAWKPWVMPLLEPLAPKDRLGRLASFFPQVRQTTEERLLAILNDKQTPQWVRACAAHASTRLSIHFKEGEKTMLSKVERVLILKTVPMFSQTPDNVLADVADLLEEMDVSENETIIHQGDPGDSMYMILDGKVRVHDGEHLLNTLGEHDIFGEMALLDPEPRVASVTTLEPTRLFRLEQSSFYELMAERPEVAAGIIRVLTAHLRSRVRDIGILNERIQELEGRPVPAGVEPER